MPAPIVRHLEEGCEGAKRTASTADGPLEWGFTRYIKPSIGLLQAYPQTTIRLIHQANMLFTITLPIIISALCALLPFSMATPVDVSAQDIAYLKTLPKWTDQLTAMLPDDPAIIAAWRRYAEHVVADSANEGDKALDKRTVDYDDGYFSIKHFTAADVEQDPSLQQLQTRSFENRQIREGGWSSCQSANINYSDYMSLMMLIIFQTRTYRTSGWMSGYHISAGSVSSMAVQTDGGSSDFDSNQWQRWINQVGLDCGTKENGSQGDFTPWGYYLTVGFLAV